MAKRPPIQVFNISFLDVICCGFGAVILLFVLTSGKKSEALTGDMPDFSLSELQQKINSEKSLIEALRAALNEVGNESSEVSAQAIKVKSSIVEKQRKLSMLLARLSGLEKKKTLLGELKSLPTTPEETPVPIPNPVRRQYLTGFKLDGERVLFLVESSGGMLADNTDDAIASLAGTATRKKQSPKWLRAVKAVKWMLSSLRPPSKYQIITFDREARTILPIKGNQWLSVKDKKTTAGVFAKLDEIVPQGGANLEQALWKIGQLPLLPDNIILVTDGLPTLSDWLKPGQTVDPQTREKMFRTASHLWPAAVPVNVILLPMTGDPSAASLYWQLASRTNGSLICPAKNWPDI